MKPVQPKHFYVSEWMLDDPVCVARMERMMAGFGVSPDRVEVVREEDLDRIIIEKEWTDLDIRQGRIRFEGDPDVFFNKFRWPTEEEAQAVVAQHPLLQQAQAYTWHFLRMLYGINKHYHYEDGKAKRDNNNTCWSLYDLHSAYGCFHKCQYCRRGRVTNLMLNVEEFIGHVDQLMAANPWQKVYRYDVETDCLILEPEYGMCRALVEHYADLDGRYIILFSKSDNVDFLLDLEHNGHTIMLWTLSTPTVSRLIERDTATTEQRLAAARKCQEAGYTVRFKFKPIIPIANWRQEATRMLELLFDYVQPDNLSMEMLFFNGMAEFRELFDVSLFDPELLSMMEAHEAAGAIECSTHTFPMSFRGDVYEYYLDEIRRLSPGTRVSLCAETKELWERLGAKCGMNAGNFVCNCGPVCLPSLEPRQVGATPDGKAVIVSEE